MRNKERGWISFSLVALMAVCFVVSCGGDYVDQSELEAKKPPTDLPDLTPDSHGKYPHLDRTAGCRCFYDAQDRDNTRVLVDSFWAEEQLGAEDTIHVVLVFDPDFVDNTYGVNSSWGYEKPHTFQQLVGSDHALVGFVDENGNTVLEAKLDYISEYAAAPSGYRSAGIWGGDGKMIVGDPSSIRYVRTSLDYNMNELGCVFVEDSPIGADCLGWEYRVVYEIWILKSVFAGAAFAYPDMQEVHASPAKDEEHTLPTYSAPCPPPM